MSPLLQIQERHRQAAHPITRCTLDANACALNALLSRSVQLTYYADPILLRATIIMHAIAL